MLLPEHKFIIEKISTEHTAKSGKSYREIILKKNAPTDEFGDSIGKDDLFKVVVYEKNLEQIKGMKPGDKVAAQLYMNREEKLDQNSKVFYAVNFSIRQIKIFNPEKKA